MAGRGRQIVVEFLGEDKSLSSTARKVDGTTSKLGGKLGKVGMIAGGVMAAGIGAGAVALVGMAKSAAEDQAAQARLAQQLKNTTGASGAQIAGVEKWITAQGKALGVTDDQLRPAMARLVTATGDVGKAQQLAALGMDVSAGTGKSLEAVTNALAKAQNGSTAGLAKLGIATKDASGKALTFEQIQKNLGKAFKGQAATGANTLAGRVNRLKVQFDEAKETIGAKLLPVAEKLVGWFVDKGLPAMTKFGKYLQGKLGPVFATVGGFLKKFGKDGDQTSGKFSKMVSTLKGIFGSLTSIVKSVVSIVSSLWKRFGSTILKYAEGTFKNVVSVIGGALKIIAGIFKVIASVLKGDWAGAWDGIKKIASGAWQVIKAVISQGWNVIKSLFSVGASALKGIFGGLWNALKSLASAAWNALKSVVSAGWNSIKSAFSSAGNALKSTFAGIWNGLKQKASEGLNGIVTAVKSLPGKITAIGGKMKAAGQALMQSMLDGISKAAGFVGKFAGNVWTSIKKMLNSGIDKINNALDFSVKLPGGLGSVRINAPNIPHLYKGGIIPASKYGMPFVGGDRGHAEAVIPIDGPHAPNLGGGDITLVVQLDSEVVHRSLVRRKRNLGRELGLA